MKDKSTCDFGRELENYIAEKFKELGYKNACRSNGSGNKGSLGDISGQDLFICELKNRNTESVTINKEVWEKLTSSVPLHSNRLPMLVLRNKNKQTFCVMEAEDMFTIVKGWLASKDEDGDNCVQSCQEVAHLKCIILELENRLDKPPFNVV